MKSLHRNNSEKGAAVVEAAITMLAFFMFIFGTMEVCRLIEIQQTLTDAAREGARLGCAPDAGTTNLPSTSEIQGEVNRFLQGTRVRGATIQVDPAVTDARGVVHTRVTVSYTHQVIALSPIFSNLAINLRGLSEMRNETSP